MNFERGDLLTAEEYLLQVRLLNKKIKLLMQDIEDLRGQAGSVGDYVLSPDLVQSSRNLDGFSRAAILQLDKEKELEEMVAEYELKKKEITSSIEEISDPDVYEVLYMYYVQGFSWKYIAREKEMDYSRIHRLKKRGLAIISHNKQ